MLSLSILRCHLNVKIILHFTMIYNSNYYILSWFTMVNITFYYCCYTTVNIMQMNAWQSSAINVWQMTACQMTVAMTAWQMSGAWLCGRLLHGRYQADDCGRWQIIWKLSCNICLHHVSNEVIIMLPFVTGPPGMQSVIMQLEERLDGVYVLPSQLVQRKREDVVEPFEVANNVTSMARNDTSKYVKVNM